MPAEHTRIIAHLTRRRLLVAAGGAVAAIGLYTWRVEPHWVEIVERSLPIANLPPDLAGRTLVQISDLHVGRAVDSDYLINCLQRVSALRPDMVAITGDFMSCQGTEQIAEVARIFTHLRPATLGCFAIMGNHDYAEGWSRPDVAAALTQRLTRAGIHVLRNQMSMVSGLQLVGLDDLWSPNFRPEDVIPQVDPRSPVLTLCHNPDAADLPDMANHPGWILAGHTHGGQCKPPFLPPPQLPVVNRRYTSGEFALSNGRHLYINRGLGHLLRVRFNCRPEITLFRLALA